MTGNKNAVKHGGHVPGYTKEQLGWVDTEKKRYMDAYPWLTEPAMEDLLVEALKIKTRINALSKWIDEEGRTQEEKQGATALVDKLQHTWRLMLMSLGLTYTSQQYTTRRKEGELDPMVLLEKLRKEGKKIETLVDAEDSTPDE